MTQIGIAFGMIKES